MCTNIKCLCFYFPGAERWEGICKGKSSHTNVIQPPSPKRTSRSPRFTVISHIYVDSLVSPQQTNGRLCLQVNSCNCLILIIYQAR